METLTLIGQAVMVGLQFGWLAIGAWENVRAPSVNRDLVGAVLSMTRVRDERPEIYEVTKGNRIEDPRVHAALYAAIVAAEIAVAAVLAAGALALLAAAFGWVPAEPARIVAGAGVIGFTAIWGAFLVGGQWVHYCAAWKDSQFTHYFMTIWGVATFVALT
jgi:hypothetical protein